MSLLFFVEV